MQIYSTMQRRIFLLFCLFSTLHAVEKISVIVPCHYSHFYLLHDLVEAYANQTVIPNEIIISLSQSDQIPAPDITAFKTKNWPFKVILLCHLQKLTAALNRKMAAKASTGDLILFQDADDLPHPKRVEIVKYIFEHNRIHHLVHSFVPEGSEFPDYSIESTPLIKTTFDLLIEGIPADGSIIPLQHGHICVTRPVIINAFWKPENEPGEDIHFNIATMRRFMGSCYVTPLRLVLFRGSLSFFSNTPPELR